MHLYLNEPPVSLIRLIPLFISPSLTSSPIPSAHQCIRKERRRFTYYEEEEEFTLISFLLTEYMHRIVEKIIDCLLVDGLDEVKLWESYERCGYSVETIQG